MNKDLIEFINVYATQNHETVLQLLNEKSKQNLISMLIDLTTQYVNDKNSSTLREFLVVTLSGFEPLQEKIGYNGYRHLGISSEKEFCEVKPKNILSEKGNRKLDGGGNFTDYSWKKLERHKKENPTMLIGGFIDGRLIYIVSFKFNTQPFINRIEHQLKKHFPNGDETGKYLRSASFTLNAYKDAQDLKINLYIAKKELQEYRPLLTKGIFDLLNQ